MSILEKIRNLFYKKSAKKIQTNNFENIGFYNNTDTQYSSHQSSQNEHSIDNDHSISTHNNLNDSTNIFDSTDFQSDSSDNGNSE